MAKTKIQTTRSNKHTAMMVIGGVFLVAVLCFGALAGIKMANKDEKAVIEDPEFYKRVKVGYDLIFNPPETKFMKLCKEAGAKSFNGSKMLLYQGIIAYEYWTGLSISDDLADECYAEVF